MKEWVGVEKLSTNSYTFHFKNLVMTEKSIIKSHIVLVEDMIWNGYRIDGKSLVGYSGHNIHMSQINVLLITCIWK